MSEVMHRLLHFDSIEHFSCVEDFGSHLSSVLSGGVYVYDDGVRRTLIFGRALVDRVRGLRIEIFPREHEPAHFHVTGPNLSASFRISDGSLLNGQVGRREADLIQYWYGFAKPRLVEVWNATRPSDCPVGKLDAS